MLREKDFFNILVAEDNQEYASLIGEALSDPLRSKKIGFSFASDHLEFLKKLSSREKFDAVFVSISFLDSIVAGYDSPRVDDFWRGHEVIIIASEKDFERARKMVGEGAADCLVREKDGRRAIQRVLNYVTLSVMMQETLAEKTSAGIIIISGDRIVYVNPAAAAMGGYSIEELIGKSFWEFVHPLNRQMLQDRGLLFQRIDESPVDLELMVANKAGGVMWLSARAAIIEYHGRPSFLVTAIDITARKHSEEMLSLDESRLEALLSLTRMTGASLKEITDFTLDQAVKLTGSRIGYLAFTNDDESILSMYSWSKDVMAECNLPNTSFIFQTNKTGLWGEALRQRKPIITNDYAAASPLKKGYPEGHVLIRRHMNVPIFEGEHIVALAGVGNKEGEYNDSDLRQLTLLMTEMWRIIKRGNDASELRARTSELQQIFKALPDIYFRISSDGVITDYKAGNADDLFVAPDAFLGKKWQDILPEVVIGEFETALEKVRMTGNLATIEYELPAGVNYKNFEARVVSYMGDQFIVLIRNITDRKRAETALLESERKSKEELEEKIRVRTAELREANVKLQEEIVERMKAEKELAASEKRLKGLVQNSLDMIFITSPDGLIAYASPSVESNVGYKPEEMIGKSPLDFLHPDDQQLFTKTVRTNLASPGVNIPLLYRYRKSNGDYILLEGISRNMIDIDGVNGIVANLRDVTERNKLQDEIIRTSKLESLGMLAGGIAHDFNNVLMGIVGNITLAKKRLKPEEKTHEILVRAENIAYRARNLTEQLITFSRGGLPITRISQINGLVSDSAQFSVSGSNITCKFNLAPDLWPVKIDEGQIAQVLTNLAINAKQAMPDGGVLEISTQNFEFTVPPDEFGRRKFVKISVHDHGCGILPENLTRIFDPYFTTKSSGNGLGLSTSYSIIKNHGGFITVDSTPEKGTSFFIYIPAVLGANLDARKDELPLADIRGRRVLIMDDDETVIIPLHEMLVEFGVRVIIARTGEEAINLYRANLESKTPFDVVIMDLVVRGGLGGFDTIKHLLEIDPGVRAIVSSGYSNDPVMSDYKKFGFVGVLSKPYQQGELNRLIDSVIRERNQSR